MTHIDGLYRARYPEGTHLAPSLDTPGAVRGTTLDDTTNVLTGQAEFFPVGPDEFSAPSSSSTHDSDEEDYADGAALALVVIAASIAVGVLLTVATIAFAPRVQRWWTNTSLPAIQRLWRRVRHPGSTPDQTQHDASPLADATAISVADFSTEIDSALAGLQNNENDVKARERVLGIILASAMIAEKLRGSVAADTDPAQIYELTASLRKLSTPDAVTRINTALADTDKHLDAETSALITRYLVGSRMIGSSPTALTANDISEVLEINI